MGKEKIMKFEDSNIFSDELLQVMEENEKKFAARFKKMFDGEPKNINPLKEIPVPQMRLYGFLGPVYSKFFDTEEELIEYAKNHNAAFGEVCVLDYLGNVAGRSDVIREITRNDKKLYTVIDEEGYAIYNDERSNYKGKFVWEYTYGNLKEEYLAFKMRGIVFENDIYAKADEKKLKLLRVLLTMEKGNEKK